MEEIIQQLKSVQTASPSYASDYERLLQQLAELRDPACICALIELLDDKAPYDEVMFSIIHLIETFEDSAFVKEFARALPQFVSTSPRWAAIMHMRILNSPNTLEAYIKRLVTSEASIKSAAEEILTEIARKRPEFQERIKTIQSLLRLV